MKLFAAILFVLPFLSIVEGVWCPDNCVCEGTTTECWLTQSDQRIPEGFSDFHILSIHGPLQRITRNKLAQDEWTDFILYDDACHQLPRCT
jgi:hypothetical protein